MFFDSQAEQFESRAGLPGEIPRIIANAIQDLARSFSHRNFLEMGAGTGEIGKVLADFNAKYVAVDVSFPMLHQFRLATPRAALVQANGEGMWPVKSGSVGVVFGSRSLHFLELRHLAKEFLRVTGGNGCLMLGQVRRSPDSVKERMRSQMREGLREAGFEGRSGRNWRERLSTAFHGHAQFMDPVSVAHWTVDSSPRQSLQSWAGKEGLGGHPVPEATKKKILDDLTKWAESEFGSLDTRYDSVEKYVLQTTLITDDTNLERAGDTRVD